MPLPATRALPLTDHANLIKLKQQGQSVSTIALKLACSTYQVRRVLSHYGQASTSPVKLVLSSTQIKLIAQFQDSRLLVTTVAKRLGVDWRRLSHELRGLKHMSPRRLVQLARALKMDNLVKQQAS